MGTTKKKSAAAAPAAAPVVASGAPAPAPAPAPAAQAPAAGSGEVGDTGSAVVVAGNGEGASTGAALVPTTPLQSSAPLGDTTAADAAGDATGAPTESAGTDTAGTADADADNEAIAAVPEITFPITIRLRNHSGIAIAEPVSGAFLAAGGTAEVELHDEAHASRVFDNLVELKRINRLADDALQVARVHK